MNISINLMNLNQLTTRYIPKINALKLSLQSNKIEKNIAMDFNEIIYLCVPGKETDQITINKIN